MGEARKWALLSFGYRPTRKGNSLKLFILKLSSFTIGGTTGSGKSEALNTILYGLKEHYSPQELRLSLVDPKTTELIDFEGDPHVDGQILALMMKQLKCLAKPSKKWSIVIV